MKYVLLLTSSEYLKVKDLLSSDVVADTEFPIRDHPNHVAIWFFNEADRQAINMMAHA